MVKCHEISKIKDIDISVICGLNIKSRTQINFMSICKIASLKYI